MHWQNATERHSICQKLSDAHVAELDARRRALNLSPEQLLDGVAQALRSAGYNHSESAVKKRLDRVFNPRMRRPISESTKSALAHALEWTIPQLEGAIRVSSDEVRKKRAARGKGSVAGISEIARDLDDVARRLARVARKLRRLEGKKRR